MSLRVAFLWHQHQPYYKYGHHHLLPWARLHATKDYYDIAAALEAFPSVRQTINVVPSLLVQLQDYAAGTASDTVLELSARPAAELTGQEKIRILRDFFLCNVDRMVLRYPRYAELYRMGHRDRTDEHGLAQAAAAFAVQDWLDLQVWYNLTWVGEYSRGREPFASLLRKGRGFTEQEKLALLEATRGIIASVIPTYRRLLEQGRVELSVTPFYHPILPLLCDSHTALEAMPNAELPTHHIEYPEDARTQIARAIDLFADTFGRAPGGMWPSEGAISDAAAGLMAQAGLGWTATDEGILRRTLGERWHPLAKYFPYRLKTRNGPIWTVFRDHELSDAIGFVYSSWDPEAAALDFYNRLIEIRSRIVQERGAAALERALVPIILDGENCWEFYQENGRPFLEALYRLLEDSREIVTTTIADALADTPADAERTLGRIYAGSWVGSNFKIWIGHPEDNAAWDALAGAREALMAARDGLDAPTFERAMEAIYIAEGSDWFWWFGDENTAADQDSFDALFRAHLRDVYQLIGREWPSELDRPIRRPTPAPGIRPPTGPIAPCIDGRETSLEEWAAAGRLMLHSTGGAMHRAETRDRTIYFGRDTACLYVRLDIGTALPAGHELRLTVQCEQRVTLRFGAEAIAVERPVTAGQAVSFDTIRAAVGDVLELAIPIGHLMHSGNDPGSVALACEMIEHSHVVERFPLAGEFHCPLQQAFG